MATVTLAELYAGAYKWPRPARLLALIHDLLQDLAVLDFDAACAEQFGRVRGSLLTLMAPERVTGVAFIASSAREYTPAERERRIRHVGDDDLGRDISAEIDQLFDFDAGEGELLRLAVALPLDVDETRPQLRLGPPAVPGRLAPERL